ncbi:MAG: AP2 domain-containing protein [Nanoarchaeota archaeon]
MNITHKMSLTPTYSSWRQMKQRCLNPKASNYKYYGERGIKICKRWLKFKYFYFDMGDCPKSHSLDRIDNNGNYELKNTKWSTQTEQQRNRRISKNNTTGAIGVSWHKGNKRYRAEIRVPNKRINLGYFDTLEEAKKARKQAEQKYWNKGLS